MPSDKNAPLTKSSEFKHSNERVKEHANIWLDQDPGCDDALALFTALFSTEISVKGLTISGGNVGRKHCLRNAKNLLKEWGHEDLPIYLGAEVPIIHWKFSEDMADGWHGDRGLSRKIQEYFEQNPKEVRQEVGKTFADLHQGIMALESKVTYIITGPCTTFALLSKVYPDVLTKIDRVMVMGSGLEMGNITPHAEFNTYCDPESLEVVAHCPIEKVIYPLEPLDFVSFNDSIVKKVKNHPSPFSWMLGEMYDQLEYSYRKECGDNGIEAVSYDSGLIPALIRKDYVKMSPCNLKVLKDGELRGKTTYTLVEESDINC